MGVGDWLQSTRRLITCTTFHQNDSSSDICQDSFLALSTYCTLLESCCVLLMLLFLASQLVSQIELHSAKGWEVNEMGNER